MGSQNAPQIITREQVRAAYTTLGLDPDRTRSVSIYGDSATIVTVTPDDDGDPLVVDGALRYDDPVSITITDLEESQP